MKRLLVDAGICAGCRYCEMVCSFHHEGRFGPSLSRVVVIKEDKHGMDFPVFCRHCNLCPPMDACPTHALSKNERGIVTLDEEACTGCGVCLETCTFDALRMGESSKPLICDLCGGDPVCVEKCPTKALSFVESDVAMGRPEEVFRELRGRWGISG